MSCKIKIWRKNNLSNSGWTWRMRCDACVIEGNRLVVSASLTWRGALSSALRHAELYHNVTL